jgi:ankyrin repeat protein
MSDLEKPQKILNEAEQKKVNDSLLRAAENGRVDTLKSLIGAGAAVEANDRYGNTPLHKAAMHGHIEVIKLLLQEHTVEINRKNIDGYTPLHLAALIGHLEEIHILLEYSANSTIKNADGDTPLHYAAGKGQVEIVEFFLRGGAAVNSRNNRGDTPLKIAGTWQWVTPEDKAEVCALLLAAQSKQKPSIPGQQILAAIVEILSL